MRLWHKDLISVLPRQQLLGQWRECCLIAKNIAEKSTPNHILVNKIIDYPIEHFHYYAGMIYDEMERRGYKCDYSKFDWYIHLNENHCTYDKLFKDWHNDRYLSQCFYNLQEKYDCGRINETEYALIRRKILEIKGLLRND
jgi:uncharacterized protein (TIGR02328 family)